MPVLFIDGSPRAKPAGMLIRRIGARVALMALLLLQGAQPLALAAAGPGVPRQAAGSTGFHTAPAVSCDAMPWLCGIVLGTWQPIVNPTWSGPGSHPIYGVVCEPDGCMFATLGGGRFVVALPGYLFRGERPGAERIDDMALMRAMVQINPRWLGHPGSVTGMEPSVTIAPSFATKLRAAGIEPAVLLAWILSDLPGHEVREYWHAPVFGGSSGFDVSNYTLLPAGERGGWVRGATTTVKQVEKAVARTAAASAASVRRLLSRGPKAVARRRASPTASAGAGSHANPYPAPVVDGRLISVGSATLSPLCPPGTALLREPGGGRCMPAAAVLRPSRPWWQWALGGGGAAVVLLLAANCVAARLRLRSG